jgi:two-component system, chemotaxis family, chemotaxis protein CheY
MRLTLKNILIEAGYEIIGEAENGRESIDKYKQLKPDLVTMDITMPEMNGIQALREILKLDENARVIMCSSMGQEPYISDAIRLGAKAYIVKPFRKNNILKKIKNV